MFLLKIYKHNKWLFAVMMLCVIAQLFINFKRGMVVSPFYHYGMYSEVMNENQTYNVFEVEINNERLQAKKFSPQQWDKIIEPLSYYSSIDKSNELYFTQIKRLMSRVHLSVNDKNFVQACNYNSFLKWYKDYLEDMLSEKINTLSIQRRVYNFNNGQLQPTDSLIVFSEACN